MDVAAAILDLYGDAVVKSHNLNFRSILCASKPGYRA